VFSKRAAQQSTSSVVTLKKQLSYSGARLGGSASLLVCHGMRTSSPGVQRIGRRSCIGLAGSRATWQPAGMSLRYTAVRMHASCTPRANPSLQPTCYGWLRQPSQAAELKR
jgi:hypothetical protein